MVWKSKDAALTLKDVAYLLAPALWFSSEEPLITKGILPVPSAHPCDEQSEHPVVYYQSHRIVYREGEPAVTIVEDDPSFLSRVASFSLRYFFYYPRDYGMAGHEHDLETAEFQVHVEKSGDGCTQIRIDQVIGFAHGLDWYYNRLKPAQDTKFPVMLLIEEGKHATVPDRNADGIYIQGYDVNQEVNNAWGLRDGWGTKSVLKSILLFGHGQKPSRSNPRDPAFRVLPPEQDYACLPEDSIWLKPDSLFMSRYQLRPAYSVSICKEDEQKKLAGLMRRQAFGYDFPTMQEDYHSDQSLSERMSYTGVVPPVSIRLDGDLGLSFVLPGWQYKEKYILPKINWYGRETSIEALITPTASQIFSWYGTAGIDLMDRTEGTRFVSEMGIKVRFGLRGKKRGLFGLGYKFAGVRVGVRNFGIRNMDSQILVEVGAGVW